MTSAPALVCAALTLIGLVQAVLGWAAVRRFLQAPRPVPAARPPVTILKPLYGDEPLLEEALASLCAQDYPAFQIVFGLQRRDDPALGVIARLQLQFPDTDIDVVVDPTAHGSNHKVSNLINMFPAARHDVLVVADSDVHAPRSYLDSLVATLARPGVGMVTTLYVGHAATECLTGRLGAAYINQTFLPGALLARALGRQDCLGATMAITRATLADVGGFAALADDLADDAVLGHLVRARGLEVALAGTVPATTVPETHVGSLFQHELRWACTSKSLEPAGFAMSVVQYPLFFAMLTLVLSDYGAWSWALFGTAWLVRGGIAASLDEVLRVASPLTIWCVPLRDLLSVGVMLASYVSRRVAWRGHVHRVNRPSFSNTGLEAGEGLRPS